MTTKYETLKRIKEMLPDIMTGVVKQSEHLLDSGAVDIDDYNDDYLLPKIILAACLYDLAHSYKPYNKDDIKTVNNLRNF
jgi:hypothetical protein